jgi:hypothetical protein
MPLASCYAKANGKLLSSHRKPLGVIGFAAEQRVFRIMRGHGYKLSGVADLQSRAPAAIQKSMISENTLIVHVGE